MTRLPPATPRRAPSAHAGQATLETALALPLLLFLIVAVLGAGRVIQARSSVTAVAREAARAGAAASSPAEAHSRALDRGAATADGYGLRRDRLDLRVDASAFGLGGAVTATARYTVRLDDLPLLGWVSLPVESTDRERIERYRSLWP
jgi:Flp pilus assembly protein TadG